MEQWGNVVVCGKTYREHKKGKMKAKVIIITPLGTFEAKAVETCQDKLKQDLDTIKDNIADMTYFQIEDEYGTIYIFPKKILQNSVFKIQYEK